MMQRSLTLDHGVKNQRLLTRLTSRPTDYNGANHYISGDLNKSVKLIEKEYPSLITWIIGGPKIIDQTLDIIDEFYLSRIPGNYNCDTYLPLHKIEDQFSLNWQHIEDNVVFQIWKK